MISKEIKLNLLFSFDFRMKYDIICDIIIAINIINIFSMNFGPNILYKGIYITKNIGIIVKAEINSEVKKLLNFILHFFKTK